MATVSVVQSKGVVDSVHIAAGSATTGGGSNGRTVNDAPVIVIVPGKMLRDVSIVGIRGGGGPGRRKDCRTSGIRDECVWAATSTGKGGMQWFVARRNLEKRTEVR